MERKERSMPPKRKNSKAEATSLKKIIIQQRIEIAQLKNIIDNLPGDIYWKDKNGVYLGINAAGSDSLRKMGFLWKPEDIIGKTDFDIYDKKTADIYRKNDLQVLQSGTEITKEEGATLPSGEKIMQLSTKRPLKNSKNQIIGIIGNTVNITYLKTIEKELRKGADSIQSRLESFIDSIAGNHWWKDVNGIYLGCNDTFVKTLKLKSQRDVIGKTDYELPWAETADYLVKNDKEVMRLGIAQEREEEVKSNTGEVMTFLVVKAPLRDESGNVIGTVGSSFDITNQKSTEKALQEAKEKAEESSRLKTQFIQNMEHDIRTPFSGVYGLASVLYESFDTLSEDDKKEILKDVVDAAGTLLNYCNSILDFAKTELGELPIISKKFNFKNLVERVIAMERAASKFKNLNLMLEYPDDTPHILIGDEYRLQQILINLIGNAIKFTDTGYVSFTTKVAKKEEKNIIIKFIVKDTGIGIPQDKQLLIYEKFTRLDPSNKGTFKGLGLGLSIVKQYIEEMDGEIDLQSEAGKGTTFICTLPFKLPLIDEI